MIEFDDNDECSKKTIYIKQGEVEADDEVEGVLVVGESMEGALPDI